MMEKLLQREFWLKIFSVVLALLLWAVVMQDYTAEASRSFEVPLVVKSHPIYQINEGPHDRETMVEIRVTDKNLVISRLKAEDFRAEVDYSKAEPGKTAPFEIKVTGPPRVKYTVLPKTVTATLVENREAQVPVFVEPKSGMITYQDREYRWSATAAQRLAPVSGRSDYLVTVKQALLTLEPKDLVPTNTSITKTVAPLDAAGKPVEKLATTSMEIRLTWEQLPSGRAVKIVPTTRGTLPKGYVITKLDPSPATVTMRAATVDGPLPAIDSLETSGIDLTGQTKSFTATLRMVPPDGTTLSVETINVAVTIAESTLEKTFKGLPIQVHGKASNVEATPSVTAAQVKLKGPYSLINSMEASAINVYVDVETLREGKYMLPIKVGRPQGVTEEAIDPAVVEVTIVIR